MCNATRLFSQDGLGVDGIVGPTKWGICNMTMSFFMQNSKSSSLVTPWIVGESKCLARSDVKCMLKCILKCKLSVRSLAATVAVR